MIDASTRQVDPVVVRCGVEKVFTATMDCITET